MFNFLINLEGVLTVTDPELNFLIKEVLILTEFMVSHGFYKTHEELFNLINPMITLLDGTNDIIYVDIPSITQS